MTEKLPILFALLFRVVESYSIAGSRLNNLSLKGGQIMKLFKILLHDIQYILKLFCFALKHTYFYPHSPLLLVFQLFNLNFYCYLYYIYILNLFRFAPNINFLCTFFSSSSFPPLPRICLPWSQKPISKCIAS